MDNKIIASKIQKGFHKIIESDKDFRCNICQHNILDYKNCYHWPGMYYLVDGENVRCFVYVLGGDDVNNENTNR